MKILITGAGGMLGSDLASVLAPKHTVVGMGRRPAVHLKIPFHVENLTDFRRVQRLFDQEKPELVLHAAAMTDVDRCETGRREALLNNFEATRNVTEASNALGALTLFFSTDFVFDGTKEGLYLEDDVPRPISVYGETKFLAERYLRLRGRRFLIIRTSWLFGKHGNDFPKKLLRQAEAGKALQVVSDQFGNPTFTRDLAGAVEQMVEILLQRGRGGENQIYHVTNEGTVSRFEFAGAILKKKGYSPNLALPISTEQIRSPAARPRNSTLSTEKVRSDFGIRLRPWEEALGAYLQELVPLETS